MISGTVCGGPYEWLAVAALPLAALSGVLKQQLTRLAPGGGKSD